MALTPIIVGGQNVTLVDLPKSPGFRTVQFDFDDPATSMVNGFSGLTQVQRWPGADNISGTLSLPLLQLADSDTWIAFLMLLRGQVNAFQLGDPLKALPRGNPQRSQPVVSGSGNLPGSDQLVTRGWAGAGHLLEAGDYIQIGYRLYRNLLPVVSTDGTATLTVWPTIREQPSDSDPITLKNTRGLFRLATSKRSWSADQKRLTAVSLQCVEWRGPASA